MSFRRADGPLSTPGEGPGEEPVDKSHESRRQTVQQRERACVSVDSLSGRAVHPVGVAGRRSITA